MKKRIRCFTLFLSFLLSACNTYLREEPNNDKVNQKMEIVTPTFEEDITILQPTKSLIQQETEEYLASSEICTYQPDGSDQNYFWGSSFAASEEGYYYISGKSGMQYSIWQYDINSGITKLFCCQPNCTHTGKCNGFIRDSAYDVTSIFYSDNRIYMIAYKEDGAYLVSWAKDASDYKEVGRLWEKNAITNGNVLYNRVTMVSNHNLYFILTEDYINYQIGRFPLSGKGDAEILTDINVNDVIGKDITGRNFYLFADDEVYLAINGWDNSCEDTTVILKLCNDGQTTPIVKLDKWPVGYYVENNYLYFYCENQGVYRVNVNTSERDLIYEAQSKGFILLSGDGTYLYLDNGQQKEQYDWGYITDERLPEHLDRTITVLDKEGMLIDKIIIEFQNISNLDFVFGDSRYLFLISGLGEQGKDKMYVSNELFEKSAGSYVLIMDKRLIGSGLQFWRAISTYRDEYQQDFYDKKHDVILQYDPETGTFIEIKKVH